MPAKEPSPKIMLEFTNANDPRQKEAFCEPIYTDDPIPVPIVGDRVYTDHDGSSLFLKVIRRRIHFHSDWTHVQLFCVKFPESEIEHD